MELIGHGCIQIVKVVLMTAICLQAPKALKESAYDKLVAIFSNLYDVSL